MLDALNISVFQFSVVEIEAACYKTDRTRSCIATVRAASRRAYYQAWGTRPPKSGRRFLEPPFWPASRHLVISAMRW